MFPFYLRFAGRAQGYGKSFMTVKKSCDITWGYVASDGGGGCFHDAMGGAGISWWLENSEQFARNGSVDGLKNS